MVGYSKYTRMTRYFFRGSGFMAHQGSIEVEGEVTECLPNTLFRVKLGNGRIVLCHLSGKMRLNFIRIMPGDRVKIEMTPYDATKGRVIYRVK
jgi:translation initiation factor IF-1